MIELILFLAVGVLLFGSLLLLTRRGPRPEGGAEALVEARQALTYLETSLLPTPLVSRFLAPEDYEFVASVAPRAVYFRFCRERRGIVLGWIGQVRHQIKILRRFHLGAARFYARVGLRSELFLAMNFASLLIACRALQILVYVGGPRVAPRMLGTTAASGLRICRAYEEALAFLASPPAIASRSIAS